MGQKPFERTNAADDPEHGGVSEGVAGDGADGSAAAGVGNVTVSGPSATAPTDAGHEAAVEADGATTAPANVAAAPTLDVTQLIDRLDPAQTPWTRGWRSWIIPLAATLAGAALRWPALGRPRALVFDETYYAKDAYAMLTHGAEWNWVDGADKAIIAANGSAAAIDKLFKDSLAYIVHPPLGKWIIAIGEQLFGMTPFGWRFMPALLGTLLVLLTTRLALRLTRSPAVAAGTGLFLAIDGMAIVLSRTAVLDGILTFLVVAAVTCIVRDRDRVRAALAGQLRTSLDPAAMARQWQTGGVRFGARPWLWAAGGLLGLAVSTKWSAVWHIAFLGLLVLACGSGTRRLLGVRHRMRRTLLHDAPVAAAAMVLVPLLVYLASWVGWFSTPGAYNRQWAATATVSGVMAALPAALRSWLHYHGQMWSFHVNLTQGHAYKANAWSWPVMARPTSFYYDSKGPCGAKSCAAEVLALGNPIVWWAGLLAILHQAWQWLAKRDFRAMVIVVGWAAGWLPWLLFQHRTIFTFYAVIMVPFTCVALARSCVAILDSPGERGIRFAVVTSVVLCALVTTWALHPLWTGQPIPYSTWLLRMWLQTWI
ncbi:MAG: phospholipid carrier-dependent glycosyltransferase [Actinomycetales bacterium]|nr:phospholipid carrier-dependent glycosyltransferase [Actinomycetales bacterium]